MGRRMAAGLRRLLMRWVVLCFIVYTSVHLGSRFWGVAGGGWGDGLVEVALVAGGRPRRRRVVKEVVNDWVCTKSGSYFSPR